MNTAIIKVERNNFIIGTDRLVTCARACFIECVHAFDHCPYKDYYENNLLTTRLEFALYCTVIYCNDPFKQKRIR